MTILLIDFEVNFDVFDIFFSMFTHGFLSRLSQSHLFNIVFAPDIEKFENINIKKIYI